MPFVSRKSLVSLSLLLVAILAVFGGFVWSGIYNVGADDPHTRPVLAVMETFRNRSIQLRSKDIAVPNLDDPQLVLKGAGQYAAMCTGCHLAPGMEDSEIRPGLYPQPPDLSKLRVDPRVAFWTIKHGVKMSAMPAWGSSHDDPTIWSMVAFLQKMPTLTPEQYREIVVRAPADEEMEAGHHHHHGGEDSGGEAHEHSGGTANASIDGYSAKAVPGAEAVAAAFHAALQNGDRARVLGLLAPEVTVNEGGEHQDRSTYAAGHLSEDIAFLKSATVHPRFVGSMSMGNAAMVATRSEIHAAAEGKPLALLSTEILTMKDTAQGWLITRIEWSSERLP